MLVMLSCLHVKSVLCTSLAHTSKLWRITERQLDSKISCLSHKEFIVWCNEFAYENKQRILYNISQFHFWGTLMAYWLISDLNVLKIHSLLSTLNPSQKYNIRWNKILKLLSCFFTLTFSRTIFEKVVNNLVSGVQVRALNCVSSRQVDVPWWSCD
jgi:hypothetical protein